jgi:hypothetical protein
MLSSNAWTPRRVPRLCVKCASFAIVGVCIRLRAPSLTPLVYAVGVQESSVAQLDVERGSFKSLTEMMGRMTKRLASLSIPSCI